VIDLSITVPGDPIATARPRHGKSGHTFIPTRSTDYQDVVALLVRQAAPARDLECPFRVYVDFYCSDYHRKDLDNLLKSIMDGITKSRLWVDDSQVQQLAAQVFRGQGNARAEVHIQEIDDLSPRLKVCPQCGKPVLYQRKVFCSQACRDVGTKTVIPCKVCGCPMELPRSMALLRVTCSRTCKGKLKKLKNLGLVVGDGGGVLVQDDE
jgi:Holliday junction resolvase RusA-like endonuclease